MMSRATRTTASRSMRLRPGSTSTHTHTPSEARNSITTRSTRTRAPATDKQQRGATIKLEKDPYATPISPSSSSWSPPVRRKRAASITTTDTATETKTKAKKIKTEHDDDDHNHEPRPTPIKKATTPKTKKKKSAAEELQSKKWKSYAQYAHQSPFPNFPHPTPDECKLAHRILSSLHGPRNRPKEVVASTTRAGCGDSPSVLDALVRTILSQNTSDTNSTRAKLSMDNVYGGSDRWDAIVEGGEAKLQQSIKCGGLSAVKSKAITSILKQVHQKYGEYSLDHLHQASSEDAMRELLSFQGVGPKTASCVLLFCMRRESFAVDTHVWRITGLLGWRPKSANRDETHSHLDALIPDEDKYGLHILLVTHGKRCDECKAGGKSLGSCELRKAFRKGKMEGEAGEGIKEEEDQMVVTQEQNKGKQE